MSAGDHLSAPFRAEATKGFYGSLGSSTADVWPALLVSLSKGICLGSGGRGHCHPLARAPGSGLGIPLSFCREAGRDWHRHWCMSGGNPSPLSPAMGNPSAGEETPRQRKPSYCTYRGGSPNASGVMHLPPTRRFGATSPPPQFRAPADICYLSHEKVPPILLQILAPARRLPRSPPSLHPSPEIPPNSRGVPQGGGRTTRPEGRLIAQRPEALSVSVPWQKPSSPE